MLDVRYTTFQRTICQCWILYQLLDIKVEYRIRRYINPPGWRRQTQYLEMNILAGRQIEVKCHTADTRPRGSAGKICRL